MRTSEQSGTSSFDVTQDGDLGFVGYRIEHGSVDYKGHLRTTPLLNLQPPFHLSSVKQYKILTEYFILKIKTTSS